MSTFNDFEQQAKAFSEWIERATVDADALERLPNDVAQRLLTLAVKLYAAKVELEDWFPPFLPDSDISQTEAGLTASSIIRAVDVELFELAIWHRLSDRE